MDEYIVEIDELDDDIVVVVAPALCLLVFGRTLDEALNQARDSIGYRLRETAMVPDPSSHWTASLGVLISHVSPRPERSTVPSLLLRSAERPITQPLSRLRRASATRSDRITPPR